MDIKNLQGSIVALVTPFNEDGSVDFDALAGLIDFHLEKGTDSILVLGTTGESSTMSHEEDDAVCDFTVKRVAGRVPVIAGSGSNDTETMRMKSLSYQKLGADGLLVITPYYNKSNEEGIYQHFKTVLDAVEIPCILYNVPSRTGCSISENNVKRLAQHPNALGIKEASGSIAYATNIARYLSDDFFMFSGNDDMVIPLMSLGARGVISVWANVDPAAVHNMTTAYLEGRHDEALKIQLDNLDLIHALFCETNPIPVKGAMEMMGLIKGVYRQPLWPMAEASAVRVQQAMKEVGLLD
ncbi:Dihydrodipicolinate synthase [Slackia heliotrinireducens]|uniref:4-hydroxy-tetrahydrodipicolinate synthase n=1 Tax=Slackia heliotrinireducens (strain ATCC 29202 / DSM 20476 / NCTC 11029 / RHS 1) TaxID=471855 RepID=C7N471_SLAHD|nr:4-hydroxy-tetrahydrodipicolinate synthase [Slackia heliotrinireducens]ACV23807.1 dihydrodipicolinate synthase [Slackia heliotrinireducens DSM 20476]VEH03487.1 Dihydrodipicolinate synthase [Slackia heliotrinireducens]